VARKNSFKENLIENRSISNRASVVFSTTNAIPEDLPSEPAHASGGLILRRIQCLHKPYNHPSFIVFFLPATKNVLRKKSGPNVINAQTKAIRVPLKRKATTRVGSEFQQQLKSKNIY